MKHVTAIMALALGILGTSMSAEAQERAISFDVRGGYSYPIGNFSDNVEGDFGFGAGVVLNLTPSIGIYGGWGRDSFGCDAVLCDTEDQVHTSGFEAGGKLIIPTDRGIVPWVKAGGLYHKVSFDAGAVEIESDREFGLQAAAGIDFPLGEVISVSPAVRFNMLDFGDEEDFFEDPEVQYLSLDIGAHFHIPRN